MQKVPQMSPQGFVVDIVINNEIAKQDIGTSTIGKVGHTRFGYAGVGKHNHLNAEQVNAESPNFAHIVLSANILQIAVLQHMHDIRSLEHTLISGCAIKWIRNYSLLIKLRQIHISIKHLRPGNPKLPYFPLFRQRSLFRYNISSDRRNKLSNRISAAMILYVVMTYNGTGFA